MNIRTGISNRHFTLVELIVVVAVIGILAAILMPALNKAISNTKRLMCGANQRQSAMVCQLYADEMNDVLPLGFDSNWPIGIFKERTNYDLRWYLDDYMTDYRIWVCTSLDNAPMDDPGNTRNYCYTPWYYFPNFPEPNFGGDGAPADIRFVDRPATQPMIQDQVADLTKTGVGFWRFNHGQGEFRNYGPDDPSLSLIYSPIRQSCTGTNITFYDGHTEWTPMSRLEKVGFLATSQTNVDVYSVMPKD